MAKVVPTVYHATLTGAAADTSALVDGVKWDAGHTVGGLSNLDDTADADKPVSTATQTALNLKANLAGNNTFTGIQYFTSGSGVYLGALSNIQLLPGAPASGPGGNVFDGGILSHTVTGNYQVSAYQVAPTTGTAPEWGPISEFVTRRVDGANFQRISFTSMSAWAGPALNDAAIDYRIQAESGGAATLLPIKFTQQQNTLGSYYEYLTLAPGNDGNIRMFRRTDSPGVTANNLSLTLGQEKRATANVLTSAGTQDSPSFVLEGNGYDASLHTASIRQYVSMTSNAGAASWLLQYKLDSGGYAAMCSVTSAGVFTASTINGTSINSATFNGNTLTNGTGTLTLGAGKTATFNNSITFAGTDSTTMTFPSTNATIARTDAAQTFTGTQAFGLLQISDGTTPTTGGGLGFNVGTLNYGDGASNRILVSTNQTQTLSSKTLAAPTFTGATTFSGISGHAIGAASPGLGWGIYHAGSISATGGFSINWQTDATLTATANGDTLQGMRITATPDKGAFTSVNSYGLYIAGGGATPYDFGIRVNDTSPVYFGGTLSVVGVSTVSSATATPAGGSTAARLLFGTTAGFGVYYGSGAPTVSAAQGSIYLRSDGSSTSTRMYINTNGSTTWTNVTTAA